MIDAVVVGAGPAGGMAARQLAAAGFSTTILEKRKVVGEPVQCAEGVSEFGLLSNGLSPQDEWIAQRVAGAKCVAPNGKWFYITRLPGYAIDRPAFDRWIVRGAVDDGADLRTATRVTGLRRENGGWRIQANGSTIDARVVIGADGPTSLVAREAGLVRNLGKIVAYEYRFRREDVPELDPDYFLLFIGARYNGGYAWIFPKGESVNVGAGGHVGLRAQSRSGTTLCRLRRRASRSPATRAASRTRSTAQEFIPDSSADDSRANSRWRRSRRTTRRPWSRTTGSCARLRSSIHCCGG